MGKFNLANDWFGPDSTLYRKANNPHDFDDSLIAILPSKTVFVDGPNAGQRVGVVRGDKEPVPTISPADYAALKLENERLLQQLAAAQQPKQDPAKSPEPKKEPEPEKAKEPEPAPAPKPGVK